MRHAPCAALRASIALRVASPTCETARILNSFHEPLIEPDRSFNVGLVAGGTETTIDDLMSKRTAFGKSNVIANTATVKGDLHHLTAGQRECEHVRMRAMVADKLPGTSAKITFSESYPPGSRQLTPGRQGQVRSSFVPKKNLNAVYELRDSGKSNRPRCSAP
jgi:hypothetical protein